MDDEHHWLDALQRRIVSDRSASGDTLGELVAIDHELADMIANTTDPFVRARCWDLRHTLQRQGAHLTSGWQRDALSYARNALDELDASRPELRFETLAQAIRIRWATANLAMDDIAPSSQGRLEAATSTLSALMPSLEGEAKAVALTNYSIALIRRRRSAWAELGDVDDAIEAARRSVALTEAENPLRSSRINNLGAALQQRYVDTGAIADLAAAVEAQQQIAADRSLPIQHHAMILNNVGQGLRELFEITGDRSYIRQAVATLRRAESSARRQAPATLPRVLTSLSIAQRLLHPGFAGTTRALHTCRAAVALTSAGADERPSRIGTLANCLLAAARATDGGSAEAFAKEAYDLATDALELDSPTRRATWLAARAQAGLLLWHLNQDHKTRSSAVADLKDALDFGQKDSPLSVIANARRLAELHFQADDFAAAERTLAHAGDQLRRLLPAQWLRRDQRDWHRQASEVIGLRTVAALRRGRPPAEVIDMIGQFRSVEELAVVGTLPLDDTQVADDLREAMKNWLRGGPASPTLHSRIAQHLVRADKSSARPASACVYLVESAWGGAVLTRTDQGKASALLLPRLTTSVVRRRRREIDSAYDQRHQRPQSWASAVENSGRWCGRMIFHPARDLLPQDAFALVPCGQLAALPWAATHQIDAHGVRRYLFVDRAVTVRATTVGPMTEARSARESSGVLLAAEHQGLADTVVRMELSALSECATTVTTVEAQNSEALATITSADFIHVAAHGVSSPSDAAESSIRLGEDELTAADIVTAGLVHSPVVFLGSCETGRPDSSLPDQSFGLPNAFLLAGASAVIAPGYAVSRLSAVLVAAALYETLGDRPGHVRDPAKALRAAMRFMVETTNGDKVAWLRNHSQSQTFAPLTDWLAAWPAEGRNLAEPVHWALFALHR